MTKFLPFVYDRSGVMTNQKCFIITGTHLEYLTAFFNSSLFKFCFADRFPELQGKTRELSKIFMDEISILKINDTDECMINKLVQDIQMEYSVNKAKRIDKFIFDLYHLSIEEQMYIGFIDYIPSIISSILTSLSSIDNDEDNILSICFAFSVVILGIGICSTNIGLYSKNPPLRTTPRVRR